MTIRARFAFLLGKASGLLAPQPTNNVFGSEISQPINSVSLTGARISTDSFFTVWRNHGDIFACIRELCENTGSAGYVWENAIDSSKDPDLQEVRKAESILTANKTFRRLKSDLIQDSHIAGNAYLLLQKSAGNGQFLGVQQVDPRTLSVVTDQYGTILRWVQKVKAETQEFQPDEILHFKIQRDPNSPVFGLSPLEPVIWDIRTDLAALVSNYAFFENDAQPAAQYILDENLNEDQQREAVDMIRKQLKGSENRHKSIALKGVKEIKQLAISQKDMEFNVLRRFTTEKVCAVFGVPKSILNYTDQVNYANGQEQTQKFWEGTIIPLQESLQEFINKQLLPAIGITKIRLVFNARKFDSREWDEASTRSDLQLGILTINEVRELRGYEAYDANEYGEWVDKPLIYGGLGVKPLEDIGIEVANGVPAIVDEQAAQKALQMVERTAERYLYGNTNTGKNRKS